MPDNSDITTLVDRILSEGPIGMSAAAKIYGTFRAGRPTHASTPTRHHLYGITLPDGTVLRLEAIRIAGRLMTSRAAVTRFVAVQQSDAPPASRAQSTPSVRRREATIAATQLDALGI